MSTNSFSGFEGTPADGDGGSQIVLRGLALRFILYTTKRAGFKESLVNRVFRRKVRRIHRPREFWALQDIDLHVRHGERLGIVGRNGAGKSTLLKLIAGIYRPTRGQLKVVGTIAPLIELGAGFNQELSAIENILLYGALLGHSQRHMESKVERILEFGELTDFADVPIKYYSSGMLQRLGFSLATDMLPEVLLVDEVFAAGDAAFVQKARDRMLSLIDDSHIVLLVSHNMELIRSYCTRTVWMDGGRVAADGPPDEVCARYLASIERPVAASKGKPAAPSPRP